jgi:deazaflavin-dependent oxidoreductase (nitroreductase family)
MDAKPNLFQRIYIWMESTILTRLVPKDSPGPVFRYVFKIPILYYRLGLGGLVGPRILLLTTIGRKTGRTHYTPLEFTYDESTGSYFVMTGWGIKTDWYRNALANPQVKVQVGWKKFDAQAEPVPHVEVARFMMDIVQRAPRMLAVFQRWCDRPIDGTLTSYIYAAQFFPSLWLRPVK